MTRHGQASPHRPFGIGSDEASARPGRLADDDRISHVDAELGELFLVMESVAVVADATDERPAATQLRQGDDRICDGTAADQSWVAGVQPIEQAALLRPVYQPHRAALEAERRELLV